MVRVWCCALLLAVWQVQRCAAVAAVNWTYTGEVKVGILHSLTGTMAMSEITVVNAERMAIDEINAAGGLLGQKIVPVVADGASNWDTFAARATEFTEPSSNKYVKAVFGCWTSASRKKVMPIFEKNNHMLFYPLQYEGQECSKNIFYTGATPNQQIEPAVDWLMRYKSRKFFLVGSDYVFPRTANAIIRGLVSALGGEVVGEMYLPLGEQSDGAVGAVIQGINRTLPTGGAILNTLNGDSNVKFFQMLYNAGYRADKYLVMSFSITETEIAAIGTQYLVGHYATWNYFMSTQDAPTCPGGFDPLPSRNFVAKYQALYGAGSLVNDPMEAAYIAVYLWAQAVSLAGTFDLEPVRRAVISQAFSAPEGEVVMQPNHHISKFVRIGQVTGTGDFEILYESTRAVYPEPWNAWVATSRGYGCDWRDEQRKGGFFKLPTVEVGLLHALTGPRATVERQHLEAEVAAIKLLNRNGGVLGKTVLFSVVDTASNDTRALAQAKSLASSDPAPAALFGRSVSDSAFSGGGPVLFSPQRELGGDCSAQVIHTGGLLNQQLWPAVKYFSQRARAAGQASHRFFLLLPGALAGGAGGPAEVLTKRILELGDVVAGSAVLSAASAAAAVAAVQAAMPQGGTILNLAEDAAACKALLLAMVDKRVPTGAFPVLFTGLLESDVSHFGDLLANHFVSLPYLASVDTPENTLFRVAMQESYGVNYGLTDQGAAAFTAINLWAQAAMDVGSFASSEIFRGLWLRKARAPAGLVELQGSNYLAMPSRLGTLNARGTGFRAISEITDPIFPDPLWLHPGAAQCDFIPGKSGSGSWVADVAIIVGSYGGFAAFFLIIWHLAFKLGGGSGSAGVGRKGP